MHTNAWKKVGSVLFASMLAIAGCQGEKGPPGDPGQAGQTGQDGQNGLSAGTIAGTVKVSYDAGATLVAVPGATVSVLPNVDVTTTTDANGAFTLAGVPVGTYVLQVGGTGITADPVAGVVVVAGRTVTKDVIAKYTPVTVTVAAPSAKNGAIGFNQEVSLTATPAGGTPPYTYAWSLATGAHVPTPVTFTDGTTATAKFTTGKFADMATRFPAIDDDYLRLPDRGEVIAVSPEQLKYFTYTVQVEVRDAKGFRQTAKATVPVGMATRGGKNVARNVRVVLNDAANATAPEYAWTVTGPNGAVTVDDAAIRNPSFVPTAVGEYTAKNGARAAFTFTVDDYLSSTPTCAGSCHVTAGKDASYQTIFAKWENSAHGNRFWKIMERPNGDLTQPLVFKAGAVPYMLLNDAEVAWTAWPANDRTRMTLFQWGMSNGEGAHYGENCVGCHAVGFNKLADNFGLDEVTGYVFPTAASGFLHDTGVTNAPDTRAWDALSVEAKRYAGMQCETCHGPNGKHFGAPGTYKPQAFFDAQACAVCHDSVGHHDRNMLFAQAGHANLELALDEGPRDDCGRCHSAQGFVAWSKMATPFDPAQKLPAASVATAADVQPVTCQACHDPHTTQLRVSEHAAVTTTSGYEVAGLGAGQLCVVCHSSRRGLHETTNPSYSLPHGSAQSDVFLGRNVFFVDLTDTMSVHAYVVKGTCAGCHMEAEHASEDLYKAPAATNHTFKVKSNVCADCHEGASRDALKESVEAKLALVHEALAAAVARQVPTAPFKIALPLSRDWDANPATANTNKTCVATVDTTPNGVALGSGHGAAFTFTWANGLTVDFLEADNTAQTSATNSALRCPLPAGGLADVVMAAAGTAYAPSVSLSLKTDAYSVTSVQKMDGTPMYAPNTRLFKAWWNYALVESDGTFGAHNPGFVQKVLAVTQAELEKVSGIE